MAAKKKKRAATGSPNRGPASIQKMRDRAVRTICKWRKEYTIDEIATVLATSRGSVWRWEVGRAIPFRKTAEDILNNAEDYATRLAHNAGSQR